MTRLTLPHYGGKGHYMKCSERVACNGKCGDCEFLDEIVEKLAEYEDAEERKPKTEWDRIRAMSDEELARFAADRQANETYMRLTADRYTPSAGLFNATREILYSNYLHFLRQPAKDGDNDG